MVSPPRLRLPFRVNVLLPLVVIPTKPDAVAGWTMAPAKVLLPARLTIVLLRDAALGVIVNISAPTETPPEKAIEPLPFKNVPALASPRAFEWATTKVPELIVVVPS